VSPDAKGHGIEGKAPGAFYVRPPPLQQVTVGAPPGRIRLRKLVARDAQKILRSGGVHMIPDPGPVGNNPTTPRLVPAGTEHMGLSHFFFAGEGAS
jgi:hypothetical protein